MLSESFGLENDAECAVAPWSDLILPDGLAELGKLNGDVARDKRKMLGETIRFDIS